MNLRKYVYSALGWPVEYYHRQVVVWRDKAQLADTVARQQAAAPGEMKQRQKQLTELDRQHMEELAHAENENHTLRT